MKEKIRQWIEDFKGSSKSKQMLIMAGIILVISSFLSGYVVESMHRLQTESITEFAQHPINILLCPFYALFREGGVVLTIIIAGVIAGIAYFISFNNPDLDKTAYVDERGVPIAKAPIYGSADWLQRNEAGKYYEIGPAGKVQGIILGQYKEKGEEVICLANDSPGNRNIMIFGSPGSGKSYGFVRSAVLQSIKNGASIVLTDPKGEIHNDMRLLLEKNEYEVKLFNLVDLLHSDAWDCTSEIINPYTGSIDELRIAEFADAIMKNSGEGDEFWDGGESNLLKAIIFYQAYINEKTKIEKYTICVGQLCKELGLTDEYLHQFVDILNDEGTIMNDKAYAVEELARRKAMQDSLAGNREEGYDAGLSDDEYAEAWAKKYMDEVEDWIDRRAPLHIDEIYRLLLNNDIAKWEECFRDVPLDNPAALAWSIFKQNSDNTRPQFITGLGQRMQLFQMRDLRRILRNKDIDLASIGEDMHKKKTALFCVMSDKSAAMKPITSLLFNFLFKDITDAADHYGPENRNTVNMILDEFVNIGTIPNFEVMISTARSRKIGIFMICQTYSQLQETYGQTNAETIIGCCDTMLCLGVNDKTTADFISYKSGVATIVSQSAKDTRPSVLGLRPVSQGYSLSLGEGKRNVINPDEVMAMPFERVLIFRQHAKVLQANKFGYKLHPMFKEYAVKNAKGELAFEQMPISSLESSKKKYAATEDRDAFSAGTNKVKTYGGMTEVTTRNKEITEQQGVERFKQQQKMKANIPRASDMMATAVSKQSDSKSKATQQTTHKKNKFGIG